MLAGADGYRKRWIVAVDSGVGTTCLEVIDTFAELVDRADLRQIIIDVPIGLPEQGARSCDRVARAMIGPRRNSVFPAPIPPMLGATSYKDACERRYRVDGKRCSRQLFNILPLIRSVDENMSPLQQSRIHEGHPEVSFTALSGRPMRAYKAKPEGQRQRRALLGEQFPDLEDNIARFRRPGAIIDILDAYVLLWSARRAARGNARTLPDDAQYDSRGLRAEILF